MNSRKRAGREFLAKVEQFRAEHDLKELDADGFVKELREIRLAAVIPPSIPNSPDLYPVMPRIIPKAASTEDFMDWVRGE